MQNQRVTTPMTSVASGVTTTIPLDPNSTGWCIKLNKDTATAGTLTLTAVSPGATTAETVYDSYGAAIVYNAASSTAQTYSFNGQPVDSVIITPAGLNGTYKYSFAQW